MKKKFLVGIDEAGRGPLAGLVAIGAVLGGSTKILRNIKDSKKLSAKKREEWAKIIKTNFEYYYVFVSHKVIDKHGIVKAVGVGVEKVLSKFNKTIDLVLLDGALKAPKNYKQKTIIKGDEKIPIISAASIIAKTTRDKKMFFFHKKFPQYRFDKHKGYGTKLHYRKIKKHGLSPIHRRTFLKKFK